MDLLSCSVCLNKKDCHICKKKLITTKTLRKNKKRDFRKDFKNFITHNFKHYKLMNKINIKLEDQNKSIEKLAQLIKKEEKISKEKIQKQQKSINEINQKIIKLNQNEQFKNLFKLKPLESKILSFKNYDDLISICEFPINSRIDSIFSLNCDYDFEPIFEIICSQNHSDLLFIIKVAKNIFGFYAMDIDLEKKRCNDKSFFFSLSNKYGTQEKFKHSFFHDTLDFDVNKNLLWFDNELCIDFKTKNCTTYFTNNFVHSSICAHEYYGQDDHTLDCDFLAGKTLFKIDRMEIYRVTSNN